MYICICVCERGHVTDSRNATATTDLIVKQLLCSSAVSDFFEGFYGTSSADYSDYLCATGPHTFAQH